MALIRYACKQIYGAISISSNEWLRLNHLNPPIFLRYLFLPLKSVRAILFCCQKTFIATIAMYQRYLFSAIFLLLLPAAAKLCVNTTVPFKLSARNGVFDVPILQGNLDATTFSQNFTSNQGNFTQTALLNYATVTGNYEISAQYCKPDNGTGSGSVLQFLTHGIGFDKSYVEARNYT